MLYITEYPRVYSNGPLNLPILKKPIIWFKPYLNSFGQILLYRFRVKPQELSWAKQFTRQIIRMSDNSEIMVANYSPSHNPLAVVIYLHTICGDCSQLAHIAGSLEKNNIAYVTYTRSGNDQNLAFNKFNFIGRIDELQLVLKLIQQKYPNVPIHAIGASAGSALLIRYLGKYNTDKIIRSAVLVSASFHFMRSLACMCQESKSYMVNKLKYTARHLPYSNDLKQVNTIDDWINFQSNLLGYNNRDDYIQECDPINYLNSINVPTLCISSLDDPIFTGDITKTFTNLPERNHNISMVITEYGGHSMFEDYGHETAWFIRVFCEWLSMRLGINTDSIKK